MFCYKRRKYWENPTPIGLICLKAAIFYTLYEIIISGWSQMIKSHKIATLNHEVSALVYATLEYYNGIFWEKEERKKRKKKNVSILSSISISLSFGLPAAS